jgi:hypothetical protein
VPPPLGQVVSAGDVIVDLGILWFLVAAARGDAGARRRRRRAAGPAAAGGAGR